MARHYYLTRSGRLRRKDNTLSFIPAMEEAAQPDAADVLDAAATPTADDLALAADIGKVADLEMGDLSLEPEGSYDDEPEPEEMAALKLDEDNDAPVRVAERRV